MKSHLKPFVYGFVLALGLALLWYGAAFAEGEPPPEMPAAPPPPVQEAPMAESGEQAAAPQEPAAEAGSPAPLAVMGGDLEILAFPVTFTAGGNPQGFNQPQEAVAWIVTNNLLPDDRKIYMNSSSFNGVTIDAGTNPILAQLRGLIGSGLFPNNSPASTITGDIEVDDTVLGFTLQGVKVTGNVEFNENVGTLVLKNVEVTTGGLFVNLHNGAISADSVSVINGLGASLDNTDSTSAGVTVVNGVFSNNSHPIWDAMGIAIHSNGPVSVRSIDASNNEHFGLSISTTKAISVSQSHFFYNGVEGLSANGGTGLITLTAIEALENGYSGIYIDTDGDVNLSHIFANMNAGLGVEIGFDAGDPPHARNLTGTDLQLCGNDREGIIAVLSGTASLARVEAQSNGRTGVEVVAAGAVTVDSILASGNPLGFGLYVDNRLPAGAQPVKLLDTYFHNFLNQNLYGAWIQSNGAVTVTGVDANNNAMMGMAIQMPAGSPGAVTLTNAVFNGNEWYGLKVISQNSITWRYGEASGNALSAQTENFGAQLSNDGAPSAKPVTVESVGFHNQSFGNGIDVASKGVITLKYVTANGNGFHGASLVNTASTSSAGVSILGKAGLWNEFSGNGESGVYLVTTGAVVLSYIQANGNGVNNTTSGNGIMISNAGAASPKPVTASNIQADSNAQSGLHINTLGAVTITNIEAGGNDMKGVAVNSGGSGAVKVLRTAAGSNDISENGYHGLLIEARGAVTLDRLRASNNGMLNPYAHGVYIDNCAISGMVCSGTWPVTLNAASGTHFEFSGNTESGIIVASGGAVTLKNIQAEDNAQAGVEIYTRGAVTIGSLPGFTNTFSHNDNGSGLAINSGGAITLANFIASYNSLSGVDLTSYGAGAVKVANGTASFNTNGDGIHISTKGAITVSDAVVGYNDQVTFGIRDGESIPDKIELNWSTGDLHYYRTTATAEIEIKVDKQFDGTLTLERWNGSAYVGVSSSSGAGPITLHYTPSAVDEDLRFIITGASSSDWGAYIMSLDDSSHMNLTGEGGNGLDLSNDFTGATGAVSVTGIQAHGNSSTGVFITSTKAITLNDLAAAGNSGRGVQVDNCRFDYGTSACSYGAPVTLGGFQNYFNSNYLDGIYVDSIKKVTLTNIQSNESTTGAGLNGFTGDLVINTNRADWTNSFSANYSGGISITGYGSISLDRVSACSNDGIGAKLSNTGSSTLKPVVISNSEFDVNGNAGLLVSANGAITLRKTSASYNAGTGAELYNNTASGAPVAIQQCDFYENYDGGAGILVVSKSNITWTSSSANGNDDTGAILDNSGGATAGVTMLNTFGGNGFWNNGMYGLHITAGGAVSLTGVGAGGLAEKKGAYIEQAASAIVRDSVFKGSSGEGLQISLPGLGSNITLTNIVVMHNAVGSTTGDFAGAKLGTDGVITITNSAFTANGDMGLLLSYGAGSYTLINTGYFGNNMDGASDGSPNLNLEFMP